MCQFASVLVLRNRVVWGMEDSHEKLIKSEGLRDNSRSPEFVRAEISPPNGDPRALIAEWKYRTDQDYRPDWYNESEAEIAVRDVLPKIVSARVFMSGEHEVRDGFVYAYGSASVEAYGSASVEAHDSASVYAYDSASVYAYDSARVCAHGSASVEAHESARVEAYDSASVYAPDSARVYAHGSARVEAHGSASVEAHDSACCHAYSASACSGKLSGNGHVVDMRVSPPRIIVSKGE